MAVDEFYSTFVAVENRIFQRDQCRITIKLFLTRTKTCRY